MPAQEFTGDVGVLENMTQLEYLVMSGTAPWRKIPGLSLGFRVKVPVYKRKSFGVRILGVVIRFWGVEDRHILWTLSLEG